MRKTGSARSNSCDDLEARLYSADIIGYLVGYAHLTNTRTLALLGDPDATGTVALNAAKSRIESSTEAHI